MYTYQFYTDNLNLFNDYTINQLMPLNCCSCERLYHRTKKRVKSDVFYLHMKRNFCSIQCFNETKVKSCSEQCRNCGKVTLRSPSERKKSKNVFCNHSCAATYNNKNKKYGIRRSKLEIFLEKELKILYPNLEIIANGKEAIKSELDFYFPQLKFALELNGPTHYEPIYGLEKLTQIQRNDKQKFKLCHEAGIELAIIDVSKLSYLTSERKKDFLKIVKEYIDNILSRLN
jgi:hypothetical protein